ncbi:Endoplasmic reticulum mannosyl-oligosaccharide 1,2-alpha-mannosidase [Leucoagaricus sp. SymC.cos]|nr:Endoplasmic reticulum mannosyl-oligosaccharide 1,2-alpha-mannosidase [Leucoagaricus sp. SymC.cos]
MSATLDPGVPLDNTFGAMMIGLVVSAVLHGICLLQAFYYFQRYKKDHILMKALVVVLVTFDATHLCLITHTAYHYTITKYRDESSLMLITWSVVGLNGAFVQTFYTYRVWKLSERNWFLTGIILLLIVCCAGCGTGETRINTPGRIQMGTYERLLRITPLTITINALSTTIDVLIASSLVYLLNSARTGFKRQVLASHIIFVVNTGVLTTICAIAALISLVSSPLTLIYASFYFCIGRFYVNSFLATLNARISITDKIDNIDHMLVSLPRSALSSTHKSQQNISIRIDTTHESVQDTSMRKTNPTQQSGNINKEICIESAKGSDDELTKSGWFATRWVCLTAVPSPSTVLETESRAAGPYGFAVAPFELSPPFPNPLPAPPPRPLPPPIPAYHRPTFEEVGEPFTPGPIPENWEDAKKQVKDAFKYAWDGYLKKAHPFDELKAVYGGGTNKFNGWGVTLYDSLDTMWIMDMKEEFQHALQLISKQEFMPITSFTFAPFFETVIRYLGGLLSAYALSGEPILLKQADDLGMKLLPAFDGTKSGLPAYSVQTQTGKTGFGSSGPMILFAEATSCQLEYKYLAKLTGRKEYYETVERVMDIIYDAKPKNGLFADKWTSGGKQFSERYTVGGAADSGYEYFLKQWLQMGDVKARDQYLTSIDGIINNLLHITPERELLYATSQVKSDATSSFEHLACFLPGLLALGAHTLPFSLLPPKTAELHKWAAEGLAYTCYLMYADSRSGLSPDNVKMNDAGQWVEFVRAWEKVGRPRAIPPGLREGGSIRRPDKDARDYRITQPSYYLRPETVESFFILYKITGNVKWRERGWEIFQAIQKYAKTKHGYGSISNVDRAPHFPIDDMPSFFLAETLKYLYLLFDDTDIIPLDKWIFNTEAHPLPIFEWTKEERELFDIPLEG